ncbi:MAG TPA: NFACT family protein [Pyrinomonadaceae bacterium]|nr:NFACT family protein [Pyrinomonadaceae bacterium]
MQQETLQEIVAELQPILVNRSVGRVFTISPFSLAIDFGVRDAGYLFVSAEPAQPRMYLIKRSARELEKQSQPPSHFVQGLRSMLGGARLVEITKDDQDRVVRFRFLVESEIGEQTFATLVCQLTGRSANLFLLDTEDQIRHALRPPKGEGQQLGQRYQPPAPQITRARQTDSQRVVLDRQSFARLSQALDAHYAQLESLQGFAVRAQQVLDRLKKEIEQRKRLRRNLERDRSEHGDPEQHKRLGDLLLANISTAKRSGKTVKLKDYFSEGAPEISLEIDEDSSLQDEARRSFARFTKAKRALQEITKRLTQLGPELLNLQKQKAEIETIIATRDDAALTKVEEPAGTPKLKTKSKPDEKLPGVRRYLSSDNYEVLVGRAALTNDRLTFKIARPHDLWLHAADYPGSHVVVRNPNRKDIPHRTIIEAARLAAKFSQAGDDSKVTVHYTTRKFLAKPKGAAPGLVRMSTFKTITVAPGETIPRL